MTQLNGSQVAAIDNTIAINPHFNWEQRLGFFRQSSYSYYQQTLTNPGGSPNFGINSADHASYRRAPARSLTADCPACSSKAFPTSQITTP